MSGWFEEKKRFFQQMPLGLEGLISHDHLEPQTTIVEWMEMVIFSFFSDVKIWFIIHLKQPLKNGCLYQGNWRLVKYDQQNSSTKEVVFYGKEMK